MTLTPPTNTCGNPTSSKPSVPTSASPARSSEAAADPAAAGASSYPDREALSPIRAELLRWFRQNRRELPFREHRDPWRIWVSEVMLQQTRVEAMLPRYRAFVGRFPDAAALAAASTDEVLAAWSGLGYYRRARALHRAAREVVRSGFPNTAGGLRRLPGVGPYTAAAIASIAFAEPVAAVDGNVRRVLARLFAVSGPSDRAPFGKRIRGLADRLMAAGGARSPGDWNQAVMELGALVCVPRSPRCEVCPLRAVCLARRNGQAVRFPEPPRRRKPVRVRLVSALIRDPEGRLLLFRRRRSPMRGLYEFPGGPCTVGEPLGAALVRVAASRYDLRLEPGRQLCSFPHTVMDRRITMFCLAARVAAGAPMPPQGRWTAASDLDRVPVGAILRKTLARVGPLPSARSADPPAPVATLPAPAPHP